MQGKNTRKTGVNELKWIVEYTNIYAVFLLIGGQKFLFIRQASRILNCDTIENIIYSVIFVRLHLTTDELIIV